MKNNKFFDAWSKIEPDSAANARMLEAILAQNQKKIRKRYPMNKNLILKRLVPVAACLVLVAAGVVAVPRLIAQPYDMPFPYNPSTTQTQNNNTHDDVQSIVLPAVLAGQAVTWEPAENTAAPGTDPDGDFAQSTWSIMMSTENGRELSFGSGDTRVIGTLEDGRTITVALELTETRDEATDPGLSSWREGTFNFTEIELEVGSVLFETSIMDHTGTSVFHAVIESID